MIAHFMMVCLAACVGILGGLAWWERAGIRGRGGWRSAAEGAGMYGGASPGSAAGAAHAPAEVATATAQGEASRRGERGPWVARVRRGRGKIRELVAARRGHVDDVDIGMLAAEVATRLRAGATPAHAWAQALEQAGIPGASSPLDSVGVPPALRALAARKGQAQYAVPAAIAVCRLSASSGAPMAQVLDSCADGITESAEAAAARAAALAEPITSAQMLALLPLAGIVLGAVMGADPLAFLIQTWPGRMVALAAIACEVVGVMWVRRLRIRAEKQGM